MSIDPTNQDRLIVCDSTTVYEYLCATNTVKQVIQFAFSDMCIYDVMVSMDGEILHVQTAKLTECIFNYQANPCILQTKIGS